MSLYFDRSGYNGMCDCTFVNVAPPWPGETVELDAIDLIDKAPEAFATIETAIESSKCQEFQRFPNTRR